MNEPESLSDDDLRALLSSMEASTTPGQGESVPREPKAAFYARFNEWVSEHKVSGGTTPSAPSGALLEHFEGWLMDKGYPPVTVNTGIWGRALKDLGIPRGRTFSDGRDNRSMLMRHAPATYFLNWFRENPDAGKKYFFTRRRRAAETSPPGSDPTSLAEAQASLDKLHNGKAR